MRRGRGRVWCIREVPIELSASQVRRGTAKPRLLPDVPMAAKLSLKVVSVHEPAARPWDQGRWSSSSGIIDPLSVWTRLRHFCTVTALTPRRLAEAVTLS